MYARDPGEAIEALDGFASRLAGAAMTTVAYAIIDTERALVSYCCAGHPPPMMVTPAGTVQEIAGGRSGALASDTAPGSRRAASLPFPAGSLLVLYSDGPGGTARGVA